MVGCAGRRAVGRKGEAKTYLSGLDTHGIFLGHSRHDEVFVWVGLLV